MAITVETTASSEQVTWHLIFIGNDHKFNKAENIIEQGIINFEQDVEASKYSDYCKISMLKFLNDGQSKASQKKAIKDGENFKWDTEDLIDDFDYHDPDYYAIFFHYAIDNGLKKNEKVILIFLAHSFGYGFFYHDADSRIKKNCLSTFELSQTIKKSFGKIDILLGVTCYIQNIENNIAFIESVDHFIGSQSALYINAARYLSLIKNLTSTNNNNTGVIGLRIVQDTFTEYNKLLNAGLLDFDKYDLSIRLPNPDYKNVIQGQFCLSITWPFLYSPVYKELLSFYNSIKPPKSSAEESANWENRMVDAKVKCEDPSLWNGINILDAIQIFTYIREYCETSILSSLIDHISQTVFYNLFSKELELYQFKDGETDTWFLPHGVGIFMPKNVKTAEGVEFLTSTQIEIILQIFNAAEDSEIWRDILEKQKKRRQILDI